MPTPTTPQEIERLHDSARARVLQAEADQLELAGQMIDSLLTFARRLPLESRFAISARMRSEADQLERIE